MRNTVLGLLSILSAGVALPSVAFAEGEASAPATTTTTAATAEGSVTTTETATTPEAVPQVAQVEESTAPAPEAPAPAEAAKEEAAPIPGWFRIDSDALTLQLWVGATHKLGGIDLATDIYVDSGTNAEFDIGPAIAVNDKILVTPMIGAVFNWTDQALTTIVPQLYTIANYDVYFEQWIQAFLKSPLEKGAANSLYIRNQIFLPASADVKVGPQVELTLALNGDGDTLASLPVGLGTNINYGTGNTLGLFLGYEAVKGARERVTGVDLVTMAETTEERDGIVGRFSFVKTW